MRGSSLRMTIEGMASASIEPYPKAPTSWLIAALISRTNAK
jgi:hypothetical protein